MYHILFGFRYVVPRGNCNWRCGGREGLTSSSQVVVHSVDEKVVHPAVLPSALRGANLFEMDNPPILKVYRVTHQVGNKVGLT